MHASSSALLLVYIPRPLIFSPFISEVGSHYIGQAGLDLVSLLL